MPDEDKLVKAGVEAALKPFADLLDKLAGPAIEEIGLTLKDHFRVFRFRRQLRLLEGVNKMLKDAGLRPRKVEFKLLKPILEAGSLEEDDNLQDRWAALLANTATRPRRVHPSFIEILKQITPLEATVLDVAYKEHFKEHLREEGMVDENTIVNLILYGNKTPSDGVEATNQRHREQAFLKNRLKDERVDINLERLSLVKVERAEIFWYKILPFGVMFVDATHSPKDLINSSSE